VHRPQRGIPRHPVGEAAGLPCEGDLLDEASPHPIHDYRLHDRLPDVQRKTDPGPIEALLAKIAPELAALPIRKGTVLGLDVGTGSCGYALLDGKAIVRTGVRLFETAGLNHKNGSKQQQRRAARAVRVRLRRHRQRRAAVRGLLLSLGLPDPVAQAGGADPYQSRAAGLDRCLDPLEWSTALYHIAKYRGLATDRMDVRAAAGFEDADADLCAYRTVGEMLALDPRYAESKRNRAGSYREAFTSAALREEAATLFACQRRLGNAAAGEAFEEAFLALAFAIRGTRDGEGQVGTCPFCPDRRRGARHAPTMERYLFLNALTKLRFLENGAIRRLNADELAEADAMFGRSPTVAFGDLRQWFGWGDTVRPVGGFRDGDDLVTGVGAAAGTHALQAALGPGRYAAMMAVPGLADAVAAVLTFRNSRERWQAGLLALGLGDSLSELLIQAREDGPLAVLRGAGPVSVAAAAAMVPHLARGDLFHDAAIAAGLDPLAKERSLLRTAQNPCVLRAVTQTLRQVQAVLRAEGYRPARLHVELADDLAVSPARRAAIAARKSAEHAMRGSARVALAGLVPAARINNAMIDRYLLWQEQEGRCIYSGKAIPIRALLEATAVQVDHILPRGRSGDNTIGNRVVCFAECNQDKNERTPYEWKGSARAWWGAFAKRVADSRLSDRKKRNLLRTHFAESEARLLRRNLDDTRYAARILLSALRALYPKGQPQRHLFARPGHVTAVLRQAWGLQKDRTDPRHHALDAIVVASADNRRMAALAVGDGPPEAPWPEFAADVASALASVMPSRAEVRRGRGQAHGMTLRRARTDPEGQPVVYERRPIWRLRLKDLERIPDPDVNAGLIASLRAWIEAGSPADRPPLAPSGTPVRRVRLLATGGCGIGREGVAVNGGVAAFGDVVRLDIYCRDGRYVAVPVNRTDLVSLESPPRCAMVPGALRADWLRLSDDHAFVFSIYRGSYIELENSRGGVNCGYVRSFEIFRGQIHLRRQDNWGSVLKVSVGTARSIRKFSVDRLGCLHEVRGEALTWRGRTLANRQQSGAQGEGATSLREVA